MFKVIVVAAILSVASFLGVSSAWAGGVAPTAERFYPQAPTAPEAQRFIPQPPAAPTASEFSPTVPELASAPEVPHPNYVSPADAFIPSPPYAPLATFAEPNAPEVLDAQRFIPQAPRAPEAEIYADP